MKRPAELQLADVLNAMTWSHRRRSRDKNGEWVTRRAPPTEDFQLAWEHREKELRALGVYVWRPDDEGPRYVYWKEPYTPTPPAKHTAVSAEEAFYGSNAARTGGFLRALETRDLLGKIAVQLFRAQKASNRGKKASWGGKGFAYALKGDELDYLCTLLGSSELNWGWGEDPESQGPTDVLYIDLPTGQVSFHARGPSENRRDYKGQWDGTRLSEERIVQFCAMLSLALAAKAASESAEIGTL